MDIKKIFVKEPCGKRCTEPKCTRAHRRFAHWWNQKVKLHVRGEGFKLVPRFGGLIPHK